MTLPLVGVVGTLLLAAGAVLAAAPQAGDAPPGRAQAVATAPGTRQPSGSETVPLAAVRYTWPTGTPAEIVRAFDPPAARWAAGHRGVDLRHTAGAPIASAAEGVVTFAGSVGGRGVISLRHGDGVVTTYEPLVPVVRAGDVVPAGATIGILAGTGSHCAPAACLHWGARRRPHEYVDPMSLLSRAVVVRLYPAP
jgi:murein DD-endopeptidase MepM/ murein hydrolase activator NlpD